MQKAFEKGIPSLFSDLKGLCLVEEKQKIIQSVAEEFRKQYEAQDESEHPGRCLVARPLADIALKRLGSTSVDVLLHRF